MKQPTRQDTISFRTWRTHGTEFHEGITGVIEYPLAIHRDTDEHDEIQSGTRKRYSSLWCITHIPTGKGFGIRTKDWSKIVAYVTGIKDHPALLMLTDETMTAHPMFQDLSDLHSRLRRELF
tara:strand:- start:12 stop:377 length:366 start_codon:yes stop_codon:yes gene_type:complete